MKKSILLTLFTPLILMLGCSESSENNDSLDFELLAVKFGGTLTDRPWTDGEEIGIFNSCTRDGAEQISMSVNANARYKARVAEGTVYFDHVSESDVMEALPEDHNFKFYAYYPYTETLTDATEVPVALATVQHHDPEMDSYGFFVAGKQVSNIVPTLNLDFKNIFATVEFHLPNDLLDDAGGTNITSLALRPAQGENFDGVLFDGGTYDLKTGELTSKPELQGQRVQLDFGDAGISLIDPFTKVSLTVAPFTVPVGGMEVVITDSTGDETVIGILATEEDQGTVLAPGEVLTQFLSRQNDGVVPVNFPVVFPLGKTDDVANFTSTTQPQWESLGIWTNPEQPQAHAQWVKVSDPVPTPTQTLETVNSGEISSPGIKGIWTGDYLEFVLPVKKFEAGTAVTVKFPMYTRQGPVFWNIEYLDGEVWKSNTSTIASYDPAYSREATFSLVRGGKIIEHTMVFSEAIDSGHVKVRVRCADGSIQADTATTVAERSTPWTSGGNYGAPFYLYLAGSDVTSVTFSIN